MNLSQAGALTDAARWVEGAMTGSLAVALATLGIVGLGLAMLSGRIDVRRGISVIFGCFLILGAPAVARGISGVQGLQSSAPPVAPAISPPPPAVEARKVQTVDDPYAGASLVL